jgi:DNA-binding NarL/FixJ family response regulator
VVCPSRNAAAGGPVSPVAPRHMLGAMAIRLVLADDSYLIREAVTQLLEPQQDIELVATCEDLPTLVKAMNEHEPDVVLTDIRMPPEGREEGISAADYARERYPEMGIVVLSQYSAPAYALALLEKGSAGRGYLLKERVSDLEQLTGAIREVAAGGSVVDPQIVDALVGATTGGGQSPLSELTPREREVLAEMAQGKNNAAIAESLVVTEKAVQKHINQIFSKLGVSFEEDVHKRVKAVLLYLSEQAG